MPSGGLDGGFGADPADALKSKGLPWPVYLAIGIAVVAVASARARNMAARW